MEIVAPIGFAGLVPPALLLASPGLGTVPAIGLGAFIQKALLDHESPLWNVDHDHLGSAEIGYLWTNVEATRKGQAIFGQAEMPGASTGSKWAKARAAQQLAEWFPGQELDFLITLYAPYIQIYRSEPIRQMALLEHELYHCGQLYDEFEIPKFGKDGRPVFTMRGHDVEEFVGVSRRYGVGAGKTLELAETIRLGPEFGSITIDRVCGTCLR